MAGAYNQGHEMRFRWLVVDAYLGHLVRDLIAHELAHVWQHATGGYVTDRESRNPVS